jgi:hypothetical protein
LLPADAAGSLPAGLPPVAPPGYNKLGSSAAAGLLGAGPPLPMGDGLAGMGGMLPVRASARASARNAAAALHAAAHGSSGYDDDDDEDSYGGRGRGRGRGRGGRGRSTGGYSSGADSGRGRGGRGRGRGRGRLPGSLSSSGVGLDELDALEGLVDPGRVKMMCPQRMGGTGESSCVRLRC